MKSIIFISSLLFSINMTFALDRSVLEAEHCSDMVWPGRSSGYFKIQDPLFFKGVDGLHSVQKVLFQNESILLWRSPKTVVKLRGELARVRDFIIYKDELWLLSGAKLYSFSQRGLKTSEQQYRSGLSPKDFPHSLVAMDNKFYIAHGGVGLISYDPETSAFSFVSALKTFQEKGRSLAVSLAIYKGSSKLVILHAANSEAAFNGLVSFDPAMNIMEHEFAYERRKDGVVDRYGLIYTSGANIYINNGGWIHELKELTSGRQRPKWLAIRDENADRASFIRLRGDFIFDDGSILGCGIVRPKKRGDKRFAKLFSRRL